MYPQSSTEHLVQPLSPVDNRLKYELERELLHIQGWGRWTTCHLYQRQVQSSWWEKNLMWSAPYFSFGLPIHHHHQKIWPPKGNEEKKGRGKTRGKRRSFRTTSHHYSLYSLLSGIWGLPACLLATPNLYRFKFVPARDATLAVPSSCWEPLISAVWPGSWF